MLNQFSRTELLLGKEAMERLAASRVAVFGIGGVGGFTEGLPVLKCFPPNSKADSGGKPHTHYSSFPPIRFFLCDDGFAGLSDRQYE